MCTLGDFEEYAELSPDDTMAMVNDYESHAELSPEDTMLMENDSFTDGYVHAHVGAVGEHNDINHNVMFYPLPFKKCMRRLSHLIRKYMPKNTRKSRRKHHVGYVFMEEGLRARMGTTLSQFKGAINKNWVIIDSQSTIDLFCNPSLLKNIRKVTTKLNIFCNAGKKVPTWWETSLAMAQYGSMPMVSPTSSHCTKLPSASMSPTIASKIMLSRSGNTMEPQDGSSPVAEAFTIVILEM